MAVLGIAVASFALGWYVSRWKSRTDLRAMIAADRQPFLGAALAVAEQLSTDHRIVEGAGYEGLVDTIQTALFVHLIQPLRRQLDAR